MDVDDDGECEKTEVDGMIRGSMNDELKRRRKRKRNGERRKRSTPQLGY